MTTENIKQAMTKEGFDLGRMLSANKKLRNKDNIVIWNANVLTETNGKVWYGDLNLTTEADKLKRVAEQAGEPLFVLREMDCRFGTERERLPWNLYAQKSVWDTTLPTPSRA